MKTANKNVKDKWAAMERYIAEIDRFAGMLRKQQVEIARLEADQVAKKSAYEACKDATREGKEFEHATVSLLLKFITPGSIDVMPLFDTMEPADEDVQGKNATEWRQEPITSLGLSAVAMRALIDCDIVLVGQLQDRILKGADWAQGLEGVTDGMAQAIEAKLAQFIEEKTK